jgi:hypothetical protein
MRKLLLAGALAAAALGPLATTTAAFADDPSPQANCQSGLATAMANAAGNQSGQSVPSFHPAGNSGQSAVCDDAPVTPGQP